MEEPWLEPGKPVSGSSSGGTGADASGGGDTGAADIGSLTFYAFAYGNEFGTINPQTGEFTEIGVLNGVQSGTTVGDLARLPGGPLYGIQADRELVIIDPVAATSTVIGSTGSANKIEAIKFRQDGVLFGASLTDLYTIDPSTGQATLVGPFGIPTMTAGPYYDLAIDARGNVFFQVSYLGGATGTLYSVSASTGAATEIGPIGFEVGGTEFGQGTLYGFTVCSAVVPCPASTSSQVITIDAETGVGTALASETPQGVEVVAAAPTAGSGLASDASPE